MARKTLTNEYVPEKGHDDPIERGTKYFSTRRSPISEEYVSHRIRIQGNDILGEKTLKCADCTDNYNGGDISKEVLETFQEHGCKLCREPGLEDELAVANTPWNTAEIKIARPKGIRIIEESYFYAVETLKLLEETMAECLVLAGFLGERNKQYKQTAGQRQDRN